MSVPDKMLKRAGSGLSSISKGPLAFVCSGSSQQLSAKRFCASSIHFESSLIMKILFLVILVLSALDVNAQTDSINVDLQEAHVVAETNVEKPTHTVLIATQTEKEHSANAFDLIHVMNVSGLNVSLHDRQILNNLGQSVVLCINGVEASGEEVEALRSKNITSIEYQRSPTGKYAGKGGVLNFKTIQYKYGGNVYLSAKQSFFYNNGDYLASVDYSRGKNRLQLIYSNVWKLSKDKQTVNNTYTFSDGQVLQRNAEVNPYKNKTADNILNVRYSTTGINYRLSVLGGFAGTRTPYDDKTQSINYNGFLQNFTQAINKAQSYGKAFSFKANYTLWLPDNQILDLTTSAVTGRNTYHYKYQETSQQDINTDTKEDNSSIYAILQYYKTFNGGTSLSTVLDHNSTRYKDQYEGSISESQNLKTNVTSLLIQLSKQTEKLYSYISAGASNMNVKLNSNSYNYLAPTGFYGTTYTPSSKMSLSLNGFYVHTLFDPSNKNNLSLPTSFFEITQGNPDMRPIKVLSNTLELNHHWNKLSLTASYMNYIYFDNMLHTYRADANYIYTMTMNDGNFYGNMFIIDLAYRMFNDKLRINLQGIEEYNSIRGNVYNVHKNIIRGKLKIDYTIKKVRLGAELATPYTALDIRVPYYVKKPWNNSLYAIWDMGNWRFEAIANNLFNKYAVERNYMSYSCFDLNVKNYSSKLGRCISLRAVWNFGYGKKVESEGHRTEGIMNSAIMKSY